MNKSNIIPFKRPDSSPKKDLSKAPAHYVEGRMIEPINVIEAWRIGHHLACVLKYISRAGRKDNALLDLNKALWYLNREITKTQRYFIDAPLDHDKCPCPQEIAKDWKLSPNLTAVLEMIWTDATFKGNFEVFIKNHLLVKAIKALRSEINLLAQTSIN